MLILESLLYMDLYFLSISDTDPTTFPDKLAEFSLNEESLEAALLQESDWCVKDVPFVGFYRWLHKFLLKWPKSCFMTKTSIGQFYIRIDRSLGQKDHVLTIFIVCGEDYFVG